jgi:hypothetical protein
MKRDELRPCLQREVEKWSSKSVMALRDELKDGPYNQARPEDPYHLEVDLLEDTDEYVHVSVAVCSEKAGWSCYHPLSTSFLVYADGRVVK